MTQVKERATTIDGMLEPFSQQGTEGIVWCVYDTAHNTADGKQSYEGLHVLEKGDLLRIFSDKNRTQVELEVVIDLDHEANKQPIGGFEHLVAQRIRNCTVHGVQKGVNPDTWFDYFVEGKPATLIKAAPSP